MIAIFPDRATFDALLPLPSGTGIGTLNPSQDGRVSIEHSFTEEDLVVLVDGGGQLMEKLPGDWEWPVEE